MVVYSQSKIINIVSKGCVPYFLGMTQANFFPRKCIGIMEGSNVKLF